MALKYLLSVAICLIIELTRESLAHGDFFMDNGNMHQWGDPSHRLMGPGRNVQPPIYQFQNGLPPGFQVSEAEWICENPKTKDMMIISLDNNKQGSGQRMRPPHGGWKNFHRPTPVFHEPQPQKPAAVYDPPSQPQPQQPATPVPSPIKPEPTQPTNGEGLIDIRMGSGNN